MRGSRHADSRPGEGKAGRAPVHGSVSIHSPKTTSSYNARASVSTQHLAGLKSVGESPNMVRPAINVGVWHGDLSLILASTPEGSYEAAVRHDEHVADPVPRQVNDALGRRRHRAGLRERHHSRAISTTIGRIETTMMPRITRVKFVFTIGTLAKPKPSTRNSVTHTTPPTTL